MADSNDFLDLVEDGDQPSSVAQGPRWKVLVIDDDPAVREVKALAVQRVIVEREPGAVVNRRVIVDDENLPTRPLRDGTRLIAVLDEIKEVIAIRHGGLS